MGGKKYKARKSSIAKQAVDGVERWRWLWPWSELPPTTNPSIYREKNLWHNNYRNAAGITKSWLPTTTRCNSNTHQRRQLCHVITGKNPNPTTTPFHRRIINHFLDDPSDVVEAALKFPDASRAYWCLLKSDTTARIYPPRTYPPNHPGPTLQLIRDTNTHNGPISGLMVHYTVYNEFRYTSDHISIRHECTTGDPFDAKKKLMVFGSVVYCGGKYYAMTLQGTLAVMEVDDTRLIITGVSAIRAVPSASCRFFKEYVVEMKGEILLVFLIHEKSLAVVDGVEVFRLDFAKLEWIRVERLRGKTMFLKEKCIWVDSAEFGCRDDSVYFTQGEDNSWCVYDMKTCCISPYSFENVDY